MGRLSMDNFIIAGIGTEVGKSVVSAILVKMLKADYWKPISCGSDEDKDLNYVKRLVADPALCFHSEAYHFSAPLSPHHAAELEGKKPQKEKVTLPKSNNRIVIESAGGVLVPLNQTELTLDAFVSWDCSWILVSRNYLGSINHTLLTIEAMKRRNLNIAGLVFNGCPNFHSESFITRSANLPVVGRVMQQRKLDSNTIKEYCQLWKKEPYWKKLLA